MSLGDKIRALLDEATPGAWYIEKHPFDGDGSMVEPQVARYSQAEIWDSCSNLDRLSDEDARLIVALQNAASAFAAGADALELVAERPCLLTAVIDPMKCPERLGEINRHAWCDSCRARAVVAEIGRTLP